MEEIKLGRYRHFKGKDYQVVGTARFSENPDEQYVVYHHLYGTDRGLWVRPIKMWNERVVRDGYDGPRFTYVEDK